MKYNPQQNSRPMIKTAAVVNFDGYDSDDDGFFDIRPVVSDESHDSTDEVFQPAYQICALFQRRPQHARSSNDQNELRPISLNNPPRRFKDWFAPTVFQKLLDDVDDPLLKEWLTMIVLTGTLKSSASMTTEFEAMKRKLHALQEVREFYSNFAAKMKEMRSLLMETPTTDESMKQKIKKEMDDIKKRHLLTNLPLQPISSNCSLFI